jgi:Double zinc ribbon
MTDSHRKKSVIPITAYVIAGIVYLAGYFVMRYLAIPSDPTNVNWPVGAKIFLSVIAPLVLAAWILLVGYVYGDAKRRGMRYVVWTLLAIFIPYAIGIILYFILRDPLPTPCPGCGASVKTSFIFCPHCATALRPTCPQCGRAIERTWSHCPNCGAAIPVGAQAVPPAGQIAPRPL